MDKALVPAITLAQTKKTNVFFNFSIPGHIIYDNDSPVSPFYDDFIEFVNKIPVATTCKIKVNMNPRTHKIIEHGLHTDLPYRCKTGILYLNTNDGYTIFEDGTKIESVENRFVSFDSNKKSRKLIKTTKKTNKRILENNQKN